MTDDRTLSSPAAERLPLLDLCVDCVSMDRTLAILADFIADRRPHRVITLDSSMCVIARMDPELRDIVRNADLITPDSTGILWAARRLARPLPERVSGVEIVERLAEMSAERGWRLFFLGAEPGVAEEAARRMQKRNVGCVIAGTHHGYFTPEEEPAVLARVREARPDVLCVGLGIPRQEKWIARHWQELGVPVMIGVGGTFDVLSGRVPRAPEWMRRSGLEWAYRLFRNPRKIRKVMTLPRFAAMVLRGRRSRQP